MLTGFPRNLFSWDTVAATACSTVAYFGVADLLGHQAGLFAIPPVNVAIRLLLAWEAVR